MKITGVKEIYMIPTEDPKKPGTTTVVLANMDTIVLDNMVANYLNVSWDDESCQNIITVDSMEKGMR